MTKLTIIPADSSIYVDGEALFEFDLSFIPEDVHALQWQDTSGWIERKGQADELITQLPDWAQESIDLWTDKKNQPTKVPPVSDADKIAAVKLQAQGMLNGSDWVMLSDVNLLNKPDWITYRAALRVIVKNPQLDQVFPPTPPENWPI